MSAIGSALVTLHQFHNGELSRAGKYRPTRGAGTAKRQSGTFTDKCYQNRLTILSLSQRRET
jgi:hypothetical protein